MTRQGRSLKLLGSGLQDTLDRLRRRHRVCGASLAILKDGRIHMAASGWAHAPEKIAATPQTLFQIGSISKTFTATLAMQLVDDGLLDLDAPLRRYLPNFATADPAAKKLTVRHLLTHSSGLDGDFFPADRDSGGTAEGYLRLMRGLGQLHAPGEYMAYCNSGFVVLQRVVEVLRDASWAELVIDRICKPLGMTHAIAAPTEALRFRMAMGHDAAAGGGWTPAPLSYLPLSLAGAGSVLSMSASDLLLYAQAHMLGPRRRAGKRSILSQASFRAMQTPQVPMPPHSRPGYSHVGLGWFLQPDARFPKFNHDGATTQYATLHVFPKQKLAFALLFNSPSEPLPRELYAAIATELVGLPPLPRPVVPRPSSQGTDRYTGRYAGLFQELSVTATANGDLLLTMDIKQKGTRTRMRLRAAGPDCFAVLDRPFSGSYVRFHGEQQGRAKYIRLGVRMVRRSV